MEWQSAVASLLFVWAGFACILESLRLRNARRRELMLETIVIQ